MKKNRNNIIQLLILAALGVAVICSLVIPQASEDRRSTPHLEVSVIIREPDSPLWASTRQGMEQAASDLGTDLRFLSLSSANNSQEQMDLIRREAEGGTDVFIVAPAAPLELGEQLPTLISHGALISLESPVEGAAGCVSTDNTELGAALASTLLEDWTGGTVLLINTAPQSTAVTERMAAALRVLTEAQVPVETRELTGEQLSRTLSRLTSQTVARHVMVFEHSATEKAAEAKESNALTCSLYGVGASGSIAAYMDRGILNAVAAWSDYATGYQAVTQGVGLYNGSILTPDQSISFFIVRREDIYAPNVQKLLFPVAP